MFICGSPLLISAISERGRVLTSARRVPAQVRSCLSCSQYGTLVLINRIGNEARVVKVYSGPTKRGLAAVRVLLCLSPVCALALGIEGSSHDPKARRRGTIAPERPRFVLPLDNKEHREYKKSMKTKTTINPEYLSPPAVALRLRVHPNTVLNWIKQGYIKAVPRNGFVKRPQLLISIEEVKRIEETSHVSK